jgi:hypothetical protein
MEKSVADEIAQVSMNRPNVVLLGAGASRTAFPIGERNGRHLPVMTDFIDIVPINDVLSNAGIVGTGRNFEEIYSEIATDSYNRAICDSLEKEVFNYFASLEMPDTPTLYDHLILSLRPKDVIATFNWDPFLIQAIRRNGRVGGYPKILFLHGNVLEGYCERDNMHGVRGERCSLCGYPLASVDLLYPILKKNYEAHPAIHNAWEAVKLAFQNAFMVTIFGYSAPQSDKGAIELLQGAWGNWEEREMEQFEIIDIREKT